MGQIEELRARKDEWFRTSPESPLSEEQKAAFQGLRYYPPNPDLMFVVEPELFDEQEMVELSTSTGDPAVFLRWATLRFEVDGQPQQLTLYWDEPVEGQLFVPFTDAAAGTETYGAGRYLEPQPLEDGKMLLDFNYAYNPYCAYNDGWTCPLTPPENRLRIPIRAGEMVFHEE